MFSVSPGMTTGIWGVFEADTEPRGERVGQESYSNGFATVPATRKHR